MFAGIDRAPVTSIFSQLVGLNWKLPRRRSCVDVLYFEGYSFDARRDSVRRARRIALDCDSGGDRIDFDLAAYDHAIAWILTGGVRGVALQVERAGLCRHLERDPERRTTRRPDRARSRAVVGTGEIELAAADRERIATDPNRHSRFADQAIGGTLTEVCLWFGHSSMFDKMPDRPGGRCASTD